MSTTLSVSGQRIKFACQACTKTICTLTSNAGSRGQCPHCQHIQRIPPAPGESLDSAPPLLASIGGEARPVSNSIPAVSVRRLYRLMLKCVFVIGIVLAIPIVFTVTLALLPIILPVVGATLLLLLSVHKVRRLHQIIYYAIWLHVPWVCAWAFLVGIAVQDIGLFLEGLVSGILVGIPWFMFGHWPARWLTPYILCLFIHRLSCPACQEDIELRSRWQCSCGYSDHREDRNILLYCCPKCGNRIGYVDCPRCEATVLI